MPVQESSKDWARLRKCPSEASIREICRRVDDDSWENASPKLENKKAFVSGRSPKDSNGSGPEARLERRLIEEVRTVALPRQRKGISTITFVASAFPVGAGKRGQIDLLGVSDTGGVIVVELKAVSNNPWWAVVEVTEYLLRLRANYPRVKAWLENKCNVAVGTLKSSRGLAVLPQGLFREKEKESNFAKDLVKALRKKELNIELYEMGYEGSGRLPQFHKLTKWMCVFGRKNPKR